MKPSTSASVSGVITIAPGSAIYSIEPLRSAKSTVTCLRSPSRVSRVVLVLTLSMASKEGHPAYRSQSDNPLQGTTLGGSPDDPRRQRTRNAPAGHATRAGTRQRQRGLPGAGDLAHPVLPVAEALRALRADAPRRGHRAGAAGLSGHLLHRQSQGGRQGLADHGLRRRELLWRGGAAADPHGGRCRSVLARRPRAAFSPGGLAPAARPDRPGARSPRSPR